MRELDVLDISARDHRRIHHDLDELLGRPEAVSLASIATFAGRLSHHEAADRLLLHPALMRDPHGRRLAAERRDEQSQLASLLMRLLGAVQTSQGELWAGLSELERVLIGHTDREEIEDFPHLRRMTTARELLQLARVRRQLERRIPSPTAPTAVRSSAVAHRDPLREAEAAVRVALETLGAAVQQG